MRVDQLAFRFPDVARETVHYSYHPTDAQCSGSDVKCLKKAAIEAIKRLFHQYSY